MNGKHTFYLDLFEKMNDESGLKRNPRIFWKFLKFGFVIVPKNNQLSIEEICFVESIPDDYDSPVLIIK